MSGRGKGKSAKKAVSRSSKAGLQFPVGRIARYLKKGKVCCYASPSMHAGHRMRLCLACPEHEHAGLYEVSWIALESWHSCCLDLALPYQGSRLHPCQVLPVQSRAAAPFESAFS